ncbi:MAG: hypothetical protein ACKVIN_15195 [Longimicrobiales bacterium]
MRSALITFALVLVLAGCSDDSLIEDGFAASDYLFVWATDSDSVDLNFLAVLDADPVSDTYAEVLTTVPVPTEGRTRGHHTEHRLHESGLLFANDFGTGKTYVFDLTDPLAPTVLDSFTVAGPLSAPHSFERLSSGNVLATFQNNGPDNTAPGGIAELDPRGVAVRWSSAGEPGNSVRPYSLAVSHELDRVVTGSADMLGGVDSHAIQIWRLSDLTLLETLEFPEEWGPAAEPRVLADGVTVLVSTFGCKLLHVVGLETDDPSLELAYDFGGASCALPVVTGDFWIQAVPDANGLVALDVSAVSSPVEVARVELTEDDWPHWIALSPDESRIVVTGYAGTRYRVILINLDAHTGKMQVDSAFATAGEDRPGVSFDRPSWAHGSTGPADPHGAVFSLVR